MSAATSINYTQAMEEADKAVKRQRTCEAKVQGSLDQLIALVQTARDAAAAGVPNYTQQLASKHEGLFKEANASIKELHGAVNKLGKVIDGCGGSSVDITKVIRDVPMDTRTLHKVMAEHFFRQGRFDVGERLVAEAGLGLCGHALAAPFTAMHVVLEQIRQRNPELAFQWAAANLMLHEQQQRLQRQRASGADAGDDSADLMDEGDEDTAMATDHDGQPPSETAMVTDEPAAARPAGQAGPVRAEAPPGGLLVVGVTSGPSTSAAAAPAETATGTRLPQLRGPASPGTQGGGSSGGGLRALLDAQRAHHAAAASAARPTAAASGSGSGGPAAAGSGSGFVSGAGAAGGSGSRMEQMIQAVAAAVRAAAGPETERDGSFDADEPSASDVPAAVRAALAALEGAGGHMGGLGSRPDTLALLTHGVQEAPSRGAGGGGAGAAKGSQRGARGAGLALQAIRNFQFQLHALTYLTLLTQQGQAAALQYSRAHFAPFSQSHLREVQQLMGCLVFCRPTGNPPNHPPETAETDVVMAEAAGTAATSNGSAPPVNPSNASSTNPSSTNPSTNPSKEDSWQGGVLTLEGTPYAHLCSPTAWEDCAKWFSRLACSLMGLAAESPLATVLAAGAAALPRLHKLMSVLTPAVAAEMRAADQLPVELDLGPEFVFHPIFACPVSRDQSSETNPPMLLPCGHVLCEQSVLKIAKSRSRVFKCPYCPVEARADNLRPLVFPEVD